MNRIIVNWNFQRDKIGIFPPTGWPLSLVITTIAVLTATIVILSDYIRILKTKTRQSNRLKEHHALITVFQSIKKNASNVKSRMFDTDSNMIIIDISANCILWNDISDSDTNTYIPIENKLNAGITSATGQAVPVGIGTLENGWYDDDRRYHAFKLPNVYHVPNSPVNILGLSSFSKIVGDYNAGGTRINYSRKDSVFTWDHGQFSRTFTHS